jgi:putative transposase
MTTAHSLSHTKWDCKYHIVWIPKYRKKKLFWELWQELGPVLRELATHRESEMLEGRLWPDHVHILISIPSKAEPLAVVAAEGGSHNRFERFTSQATGFAGSL